VHDLRGAILQAVALSPGVTSEEIAQQLGLPVEEVTGYILSLLRSHLVVGLGTDAQQRLRWATKES
jgi:DNA-binding IclR family transcriptional regulator